MKTIIRKRRQGKTSDAIKLANESGSYLIVSSRTAAAECQENGCDRLPVTYNELLKDGMRGSRVKSIVIDDVDLFLYNLFPHLEIVGITMQDHNDE